MSPIDMALITVMAVCLVSAIAILVAFYGIDLGWLEVAEPSDAQYGWAIAAFVSLLSVGILLYWNLFATPVLHWIGNLSASP